jgi:cell fate regulator YaaT (PSP1 superfamily)
LRKTGQVLFFPDEEHTVRIGSKVVVALEPGPALGEVVSVIYGAFQFPEDGESARMPGKVLGLATAQDIALHAENSILAAEAMAFCKTCIRQRGLEMKLVTVEVLHDRSKIIFFFTAPSRIDFRELVKDLVRNYRTRIELRQIGVRHETQMIGGLGNCGMVCCCHTYLRKFAPVTIKMAKEQNLFLNPAKLSGMCGRLLCCLSFEQGNYEEFTRRCPKLGKKYATAKGTVKILRANLFSQSISILSENGEETELSLEEWDALEQRKGDQTSAGPRQTAPSHADLPAGGQAGIRQSEGDRNGKNTTAAGGQLPDSSLEPESERDTSDSEYEPDRQSRRKRRKRPEEFSPGGKS